MSITSNYAIYPDKIVNNLAPASNPNVSNVENTGTDVQYFNGNRIQAFVNDGDNPRLSVNYLGKDYHYYFPEGTKDIDVVIEPTITSNGNSDVKIFAVYENSGIIYHRLKFNITGIYSGLITTLSSDKLSAYPNIDINRIGNIAICYSLKGRVFAHAGNVYFMPLIPFEFAKDCKKYIEPDISIGDNGGDGIVSITCLDTSRLEWYFMQSLYIWVSQGGSRNCNNMIYFTSKNRNISNFAKYNNGKFYKPRIAAPFYLPGGFYNSLEFAAVVELSSSYHEIYYATHSAPTWTIDLEEITHYNSSSNVFYQTTSSKPVISYGGDQCHVAFQSNPTFANPPYVPGVQNFQEEIFHIRLTNKPSMFSRVYTLFGKFNNVNFYHDKNQTIPAIAGRHEAEQTNNTAFPAWISEKDDYSTMDYKTSYYDFGYFKKSNPNNIIDDSKLAFNISPNPVRNNINIIFSNSQKYYEVEILNLNGQIVTNYINENNFDVTELESGVYFIRIKTNLEVVTKKFVKL